MFSRGGAILLADDDGYTLGTMLAPNRMELCSPRVTYRCITNRCSAAFMVSGPR